MPFIGNNTSWCGRAAILVAGLLFSVPVHADTFTVNAIYDAVDADLSVGNTECADINGNCTLRAAVQQANALAGPHIIELQPGTYSLSLLGSGEDAAVSGDLDIDVDVTIQPVTGIDARSTIIDGRGIDRVFDIIGGVANIINVTTNGGSSPDDGGAVRNAGNLTLTDVTISGNTAVVDGGAVYNTGTLAVIRSTLNNNTATANGGALANTGTATVTNSTISGNMAVQGGGFNNAAGTLTLTHVTISGNTADPASGGGIYNGATANVDNTILNANTGDNCSGTINSLGYNIDSDSVDNCGLVAIGDLPDTDPQLGALANNGGPTNTHALTSGSPAIDTGDPACPPPATDQRSVPRSAPCDIGAYESTPAVDLSITNRHGDDCPDKGDIVIYNLTAVNVGSFPATGVKVVDTLPTEMTFVSATAGCTASGGAVYCNVGSLLVGASQALQITVTVDGTVEQAAIKSNTASIRANENEANADDNTSIEYTAVDCSDCFIATAAFGGGRALETRYLRAFRDSYLRTNAIGRKFVGLYYHYSPPVADALRRHDGLRAAVRVGLMPLVALSKTLVGAEKEE